MKCEIPYLVTTRRDLGYGTQITHVPEECGGEIVPIPPQGAAEKPTRYLMCKKCGAMSYERK